MDFSSPTRVAVVGAGFIADFHLEILRALPQVEVLCVCDANRGRAEAAAQRFGVPHTATSIEELAGLGVQVAHVLVPPDLHGTLTRALLESGVGVFLEKPMVLSSAEAAELGALAAERELPLAVNHNSLFHPAFQRLSKRVQSGAIGRVEHVQATLSVPLRQLDAQQFSHWMFRAPENIVFEQAPHPFAQVAELIGGVVSAQTTLLGTRELLPGQVFHDGWLVAAQGERGTAEIYLGFGRSFTRSTVQVLGTDGSIEVDLANDTYEEETKGQSLEFWNSFQAGSRRGKLLKRSSRRGLGNYLLATLGLRPRQDAFFVGMRESIGAFHRALRAGQRPPATAEDGARVLAWCEAAARPAVQLRESSGVRAAEPLGELPIGGEARPGEVVVLGATGFIGRPTVRRLLERDLPVTAVVRRSHSLPEVLVEGARQGQVRLVRAGLDDPAALAEAVGGARVVLQLATGGGDDWETVQRDMIGGSVAVAEACLAAGVERFAYVSSVAALYLGPDCGQDLLSDDYPLDPKPEARPLYARGKAATEEALLKLRAERGLPLVILRPGVVLGEGTPMQHSGLGLWVRDNHCVGWGPGDNPLPLVWVEDVAEALARVAAHEGGELDGKVLNLCTRVPLSGAETVAAMGEMSGRDLQFHPRPFWISQVAEIGKWIVKRVGGRKDAAFPSWRDLKSRSLWPPFASDGARELLGWTPVEERAEFLEKAVRPMVPGAQDPGES